MTKRKKVDSDTSHQGSSPLSKVKKEDHQQKMNNSESNTSEVQAVVGSNCFIQTCKDDIHIESFPHG